MANHMAEVAKMLGVELGEDFKCNNGYTYRLTPLGLVCPKYCTDEVEYSGVLQTLLNGGLEIKRKPWKPKDGDYYWSINPSGRANEFVWANTASGNYNYKLGNCYRTFEEAEAHRDKWVAFYASDEVLEV